MAEAARVAEAAKAGARSRTLANRASAAKTPRPDDRRAAEPTPIFAALANERGCPGLDCATPDHPRPARQKAAAPVAGEDPAPALAAAAGARIQATDYVAGTTLPPPLDGDRPPNDNSNTGGSNADNLPIQPEPEGSGPGTAEDEDDSAEGAEGAEDDDEGDWVALPTTGPDDVDPLALLAFALILMVGGAAVRSAAAAPPPIRRVTGPG